VQNLDENCSEQQKLRNQENNRIEQHKLLNQTIEHKLRKREDDNEELAEELQSYGEQCCADLWEN
jgi:hypothetical protein